MMKRLAIRKKGPQVKVPVAWRNFLADFKRNGIALPTPGKMVRGRIGPVPRRELARITSEEAAEIERLEGRYGKERLIEIPEEVLEVYRTYRPTPFYKAAGLGRAVARMMGRSQLRHATIWIKDESTTPSGSHKMNTSIAQAHCISQDGKKAIVTDTGAGQWGVAVAIAAERLGLESRIFMTSQSFKDKKGRVEWMQRNGAEVVSSPSNKTEVGRRELAKDPDHPGSLGIGMSEAVSTIDGDTGLALGCMSYYAALHQSVIGQEMVSQMAEIGIEPDVLVACIGGGSNFCGLVAPYVEAKLAGEASPVFVAAESANIPVLTQGRYEWDYQDHGELMAMLLMKTLGHKNVPPKLHAGGLRYHGKNPALSLLHQLGHVKTVALQQDEVLKAGLGFEKAEGMLPAPESAHAILAAVREAIAAELLGLKRNIILLLTGDGKHDHVAYDSVREG
jgi:tryptophan synthase beta chain